ncbi:MAG: glycosyltransferase [Phormidesmis sp.]
MDASVLVSPFLFLSSPSRLFSLAEALVKTKPSPQCKLCVAIPVRDEAASIEASLQAIAHQVDLTGKPLGRCYEVILFANNCTDGTADIARRFAVRHPQLALHVVERSLPSSQAYVGKARQIVMHEAYRRMASLGGRGAIATTDGDTQVSSTWVAANLYEIARGADAVGGRILFKKQDLALLTPQAQAYRLRSFGYDYLKSKLEYYLDPDISEFPSRHHQHCGASLAVSADAYQRVGGLPACRTPEDVAFYKALKRIDARFCHSALARVTTSARLQGRTDIGCANQLNEWVSLGDSRYQLLRESAEALESKLIARRQLKITWQRCMSGEALLTQEINLLAQQIGIAEGWLAAELVQHRFFGQLADSVAQQAKLVWRQRWPLVDINSAIAGIRLRLRKIAQEQAKLARISQADTARRGIPKDDTGAEGIAP